MDSRVNFRATRVSTVHVRSKDQHFLVQECIDIRLNLYIISLATDWILNFGQSIFYSSQGL